jgi:formylglycine-generating enzyme required for sulfatase activity
MAGYVTSETLELTGYRQRPFVSQSMGRDNIYYSLNPAGTPTPQPVPPPQPIPVDMVRIPAGTFTMGSHVNEQGHRDNEGPQRRVTISSFFMSRNPVTLAEFRRFVESSGYRTDTERGGGGFVWIGNDWVYRADANWRNPYYQQGDNHPVVLVSWFDAIEYCNWLSAQEGLTPVYTINGTNVTWNRDANGYRLPTEAEWEYACRAGNTNAYNTGAQIRQDQANFNNIIRRTMRVGSYRPNRFGLNDMHGNVWEWVWDWYGDYPEGAQTDPVGPSMDQGLEWATRVLRGGGWWNGVAAVRSASRLNTNPSTRLSHYGFRVARN